MKTIYFDFDGTLHDTVVIYRSAVQASYEWLQGSLDLPERQISEAEASQWLGLTPPDMWKQFLPDLPDALKVQASRRVGEAMVMHLVQGDGKLYEGVKSVLSTLKDRGYQLKVLSNCKESYGEAVMKVYGLSTWISAFHCAETYAYLDKHVILKQIMADDDIVAFVGDRRSDIDAGRIHGIMTVGCNYGFGNESELVHATVKIDSIEELLELFL